MAVVAPATNTVVARNAMIVFMGVPLLYLTEISAACRDQHEAISCWHRDHRASAEISDWSSTSRDGFSRIDHSRLRKGCLITGNKTALPTVLGSSDKRRRSDGMRTNLFPRQRSAPHAELPQVRHHAWTQDAWVDARRPPFDRMTISLHWATVLFVQVMPPQLSFITSSFATMCSSAWLR